MNFTAIKSHLSKFCVGIAGAGGLGSNCAVALARSGVGTIIISDFDVVEEDNLNRQHYFTNQIGMMKTDALKDIISGINRDVNVIALQSRLNSDNIPEIFSTCDLVIEAFDRSEMKEMLIETIQLRMPGTPLIICSGLAGWGNSESVRYRKVDDSLYVCGDESSEVTDDLPAMAPRVGMVANMQANIAVELLMKMIR